MSSLVKAKKTFKIVLDSNDTNSFTGPQFNASYFVDLNKIIFDSEDFDKCYEMTVRFTSRSGDPAVTFLNMNTTYTLYIDLGKGVSTYQFRQQRPISAILSVNNDFTAYTSTVCPTYWDTKDSDNAPNLIPNLRNITNIGLTVMQSSNNAIFNINNTGAVNTATKYVCVLTFREV